MTPQYQNNLTVKTPGEGQPLPNTETVIDSAQSLDTPIPQETLSPTAPTATTVVEPSQSASAASAEPVTEQTIETSSNAVNDTTLEDVTATTLGASSQPGEPEATKKVARKWLIRGGIAGVILVLLFLLFMFTKGPWRSGKTTPQLSVADQYITNQTTLNEISKTTNNILASTTDASAKLTVNGALDINGSFIITSTGRPANPVKGQLYFDQTDKKLYFYNGANFIDVTYATTVAGNSVTSIQGLTGAVSLSAGTGIAISGTTISNTDALVAKVLLQGSSPATVQTGGLAVSGSIVAGTFRANSLTLNGAGGGTISLQPASGAGNFTLTMPAETGTLCSTASICAGYAASTGASAAFVNGGNSFGGVATLGTNDNQNLVVRTNGIDRVTIDTSGNVGISAASNGAKLYVPYATGDVGGTASTGISSTATIVQVGDVANTNNSMIAIDGESYSGTGVQGVSQTGAGVVGTSAGTGLGAGVLGVNNTLGGAGVFGIGGLFGTGDGVGVAGLGATNYGVEGGSASNTSGFFQAVCSGLFVCSDINTAPTLVTKQLGVLTADLLQAQDSSGATVFNVAYDGSIGVREASGIYAVGVNGDVNLEAGNAYRIGGTAICTSGGCAAAAGSGSYIQNSASLQVGANFNIEIASINSVGGVIQAKAGQISDLFQLKNDSPAVVFSVAANGNTTITNDLTVGSQISLGSTSSITSKVVANLSETYTDLNGTVYGQSNNITLNAAGASTANALASQSAVTIQAGNVQNYTGILTGAGGSVNHNGTGTITQAYGGYGIVSNNTTGTITTAYAQNGIIANGAGGTITTAAGISSLVQNTAAGTIGTGIGLDVLSAINSGGGVLTNNYGILVNPQTAGASDYGVAVGAADTQTLWLSSNADNTTAAAGIGFGSSRDTNLYRSAAGVLKTDTAFQAGTQLSVGGASAISAGVVATFGENYTGTSGSQIGIGTLINLNPGANSSASSNGTYTTLTTQAGNIRNFTGYNYGSSSNITHNGTGTMDYAFGSTGGVINASSGTIAIGYGSSGVVQNSSNGNISFLAAGVEGQVLNTGSGTIASAAALFAPTAVNSGGGTITTNYGINVQAQTVGVSDYGVAVGTADTQTLWLSSNADNTTANAGIGFGLSRDTNLYRSAADTLRTDDRLAVGTMGTSDTSTYLCLNSSNILAACSGSASGAAFVQGGNSFGAQAVLGTGDGNTLAVKTNNVVRETYDTSNNIYYGLGITNAAPTAFTLNTTGSTTAGTAGAALTVLGGAGASTTTGSDGGAVTIQGGTAGGSNARSGGLATLQGGTPSATGVGGGVSLTAAAGGATSGAGGAIALTTGSGTASNSAGGAMTLTTGAGVGTSAGGTLTLQAGAGGTGSTAIGGAIAITAGNSLGNGNATAPGGGITITSGSATINNNTGGAMTLTTGAGFGNRNGGLMTLLGGTGGATGTGGAVTIQGGTGGATTGLGGAVNILGGTPVGAGNAQSNGGAVNITAGSSVAGTNAGGAVTITTGNGFGGVGGLLTLQGGAGGASSAGGGLTLLGGAGGGTTGNGGALTLTAGSGTGAGNAQSVGGAVSITAGNAVAGTNLGGAVTITSGNGFGNNGGAITLQAGTAGATNVGGAVSILAGTGGATSGAGGAISMTAGNSSGNGAGGALSLTSGSSAGSGNTNGGALTITTGNGNLLGAGGLLTLQGGNGNTSGTGGGITLQTGTGGSTQGDGGVLNLLAGGGNGNGAGGALNLTSGSAAGSGNKNGGALNITSGNANLLGVGGLITIQSGNGSTTGTGGGLTLAAGVGGSTSGAGGAVSISAGNAGTGGGNSAGGAVTLTTGTGFGSQAGGLLTLQGGAGGATGTGAGISLLAGAGAGGGALTFTAGNASANTTAGGAISMTAGAAAGNTSNGGAITITTGATNAASGAAAGGLLTLQGGSAAGSGAGVGGGVSILGGGGKGGGALILTAGGSTSNNTVGGNVTITAGTASGNAANGGAVSIIGGTPTGVSGVTAGGAVTIQGGAGSNANTGGALTLQGGNAGGANTAGALTTLAGGIGTGSAAGGNILFQTAKPGGAGSSLNTLATVGTVSGTDGSILFKNSTNGTSAFIIQDSGGTNDVLRADTTNNRVAIGTGTAAPTVTLDVLSAGADASTVAQFKNAGATSCTVQPGGTGFACASDARLKTNVTTIDTISSLDIINQLRGVDFNWISNPSGQVQSGFIAQELELLIPSAVSTDSNGFKVANYSTVVPYLVQAMQEQQKQIQSLQQGGAGSGIQQNGSATLASLNVSGATTLTNLTVTGSATFAQITITGNATFAGNLTVNGHIIGNADTRGTVTIPAGQDRLTYTFTKPYDPGKVPNIVLTAQNTFAPAYRVDATTTDFTVYFQTPAAADTVMNYQAQQ